MNTERLKILAFDADDTLWDCQGHFEVVMQHLYDELVPWVDRESAAQELFATERKNMDLLGYGVKAFTLSMLETALRVSNGELPGAILNNILQQCYGLLKFPCTPLPGVESTLKKLRMDGWTLVVFTKGELLDQEHKLERSGLLPLFNHVEITSDKGEREFRALCRKLNVIPEEMLMVGNSLRSDIAPALAIGCPAVYIPFHVTWQLEHHEHFEHENMVEIGNFAELVKIISKKFAD